MPAEDALEAAVRRLMAGQEGIGIKAMVKRLRAEHPELADTVNSKTVAAAKAAVQGEMAAGGGAGAPLVEGMAVELHGLSGAGLNGQRGTLGGFDAGRGRWTVVLGP